MRTEREDAHIQSTGRARAWTVNADFSREVLTPDANATPSDTKLHHTSAPREGVKVAPEIAMIAAQKGLVSAE